MVTNYMEHLVDSYLMELLKAEPEYAWLLDNPNGLLDDMKAKALNNLPPFYITGKKGEVFGEYYTKDIQNKTDILSAIMQAIDFIMRNGHLT